MSRIEAETQAKLAQEGTKPKPKKLQDRKTKEAAMKEIYSESQRIFRQSGMQVGYHRPKQRTLEEFLQRKKKQVIDQVIGDDLKIRKVSVNTELERKLEECEKATEEFYKNDEDEEDDEGLDENEVVSQEKESEEIVEKIEDNAEKNEESQVVSECGDNIEPATEKEIPDLDEDKSEEEQTVNDSGIVPNCVTPENSNENSNENSDEAKTSTNSEEDSLKLFLEPDTEKLEGNSDSEDLIQSSQKQEIEQSLSEKTNPVLTRKFLKGGQNTAAFDLLQAKLELKPKLGKDMFDNDNIFLEDPDKPEGMEMFLQRFSKHAKANSALPAPKAVKKNMDISIVRKETDGQGQEHLRSETIKYKVDLSHLKKNVEDRPGAQLVALKQTLKAQIFQKRRAEHEKRMQTKEQDNEDNDQDDDEEILEDEEFEEDMEESEGETEPSESDEDTYVKSEKKSRIKSAFVDDEAEEEDMENEEIDEEMEKEDYELKLDEEEEPLEEINLSTPMTTMDKDTSLRWTPFDERSQAVPKNEAKAKKKLGFESLFDTSDPQVGDIDDVVGLCSGQFVTQKPLIETQESQEIDNPYATPADLSGPDTPLLVSSVRLESQPSLNLQNLSTPKIVSQKILSSDEEEQLEKEPKKVKVLKKKKAKKMVLSDSEDDEEGEEEVEQESHSEIESENEQKEIMYDSEENEIEAPKYQGFRDKKTKG